MIQWFVVLITIREQQTDEKFSWSVSQWHCLGRVGEREREWKSLIILFIVVAVAGMLLSLEHVALLFVCLLFFIDVLRCTSARLYSFHCLHSVFRMLVQIVCCRCVLYVLYLSESFVDTLVFYSIPFLFDFFLLLFLSDPLRPKSNSHWNVRRVHKFEQKDRW